MYPDYDVPADVKAGQEAALREGERAQEVARKQWERNRKGQEAETQRQKAAAAANRKRLEEERAEMSKKQAQEDRQREYDLYLASGGLKEDFPRYWSVRGPQIVEERRQALLKQVAHPRDYMNP